MDARNNIRLLDLLGVELPIVQAPMAGSTTPEMVIAVSNAGGLGSLPSGLLSETDLKQALDLVRAGTKMPINVNFFCHDNATHQPVEQAAWLRHLARYFIEAGLDPDKPIPETGRAPFNEGFCAIIEEYRPEVVSFHFGLPSPELLQRVKRTGAKILSSATTVAEAMWLEARGVDAVIAMGAEAGGHRASFLTNDMATQIGTISLVPQVVDAVKVPVIAAGGISDRRGVAAAFSLGAAAVQVGTAFLLTSEARISDVHRAALGSDENATVITNVFTGRPARGIINRLVAEIGAISGIAPTFPTAGSALAPLRNAAEANGRSDFSPMWAGQSFRLARPMSAAVLTRKLASAVVNSVEPA